MVALHEIMARTALRHHVACKRVNERRHPNLPVTLYDYSQVCQFERCWTPETMQCRGLVVHDNGTVIARPFPKFFNVEEHDEPLPSEEFEVFDKLDGSLIIASTLPDGTLLLVI